MSNVIVQMEIPKACRWNEDGTTKRCPIAEWGGACAVTKQFEPSRDNRPPWCPIKGVLPEQHGDLIDRSLLCADLTGVILSHSGLGVDEVIARQNASSQQKGEKNDH